MTTSSPAVLGPLASAALRSRAMDALLRWRAADIMRRSQLGQHLPAAGLMLDLGAGLGHLAEAVLRATSRRCVAVDPTWSPPPPLAARLMRDMPGRVRSMHADGRTLPFRASCFDGGWCAFVLHHLDPGVQDQVLAEAARVLRPGATFVLLEDTPASAATLRADRRLNFEQADAAHHYRSPDGWRCALRAHGLVPVAETAFTSVFPRATWGRVDHLALVCRVARRPTCAAPSRPPG